MTETRESAAQQGSEDRDSQGRRITHDDGTFTIPHFTLMGWVNMPEPDWRVEILFRPIGGYWMLSPDRPEFFRAVSTGEEVHVGRINGWRQVE